MYATDRNGGSIQKFRSAGTSLGSVAVARARGITFDSSDGNLYVVSTPNSDGFGGTDAIEKVSAGLSVLNATSDLLMSCGEFRFAWNSD